MKILWVNSVFLHPTTRGGQIRTLEMLKQLHRQHEIHYVALANPDEPEGVQRSSEYCTKAWPVPYRIASKQSLSFIKQLVEGIASPIPVVVFRKRSEEAKRLISRLIQTERFDSIVCDFLTPSINMPSLDNVVLFQHNVETMIWKRYAETSDNPIQKAYMNIQANRMFAYEKRVCRSVKHTIAVSDIDAGLMRDMFGINNVSAVPTGVDIDYFARPAGYPVTSDLVFVGSMDYMPNIDGVRYFVENVLPLIRRSRPQCSLTIVGRKPPRDIESLAAADPNIHVTGTVPDVRPYLWRSAVSIVPLRVGGGTRLKIYESMAASTAVVSTTIGAEGLLVDSPRNIRIADTPETFAHECLTLLNTEAARFAVATAGQELVSTKFSWLQVCREFEQILEHAQNPAPATVTR